MESCKDSACKLIPETYVRQGLNNLTTRRNQLKLLLEQRKIPKQGWSDAAIEHAILELAAMDSNNFSSNCGVGEREGRVFSSLVSRRHFGMSHGIGRSGDIAEVQPKAAGSSLLYSLTKSMVAHSFQLAGLDSCTECLPLPLATGMTLTLCLLTLKQRRPHADLVLWSRIDQKSCFKSILTAGLTPIVVENAVSESGALQTDMLEIERLLDLHGRSRVLCVFGTTSCFAPRQPDLVDKMAVLCKKHGVYLLVNNAYGLQCRLIAKLLNRAALFIADAAGADADVNNDNSGEENCFD